MHLYFRAHHTYIGVAVVACAAVVTAAVGAVQFSVSGRTVFDLPLYYVLPIVPAVAIGASMSSPRGVQEQQSVRAARALRGLHACILVIVAITAQVAAVTMTGASLLESVEIRNVLGLTGIALLGAFLFGSSLSSALPLLAVTVPFALFGSLAADPSGIWTFVGQPGYSVPALATALVLFSAGLTACVVTRGAPGLLGRKA